jgi:hypothetical protein
MQGAPLLAVQRPLEARLDHLVSLYGNQGQAGLAEATQRIARRLGPQRTALALEAIAQDNWHAACRQILDYYDRCYDHGLEGRPALGVVSNAPGPSGGSPGPAAQASPGPAGEPPKPWDLGLAPPPEAAEQLLAAGLISPIQQRLGPD